MQLNLNITLQHNCSTVNSSITQSIKTVKIYTSMSTSDMPCNTSNKQET